MGRINVGNSNIPVGVCEECGVRIRIRKDSSADYKQWVAHIKEVQKMGTGAMVCYPCYNP